MGVEQSEKRVPVADQRRRDPEREAHTDLVERIVPEVVVPVLPLDAIRRSELVQRFLEVRLADDELVHLFMRRQRLLANTQHIEAASAQKSEQACTREDLTEAAMHGPSPTLFWAPHGPVSHCAI